MRISDWSSDVCSSDLTGSAADADDLVQECLSRALARRQQASDIRNLRAYLFTILHNAHIDRLSERRRWNYAVPDEALENLTARPAPQHGLLELHDLAEGLERLPEEQRQTVLPVGYAGPARSERHRVGDDGVRTWSSR